MTARPAAAGERGRGSVHSRAAGGATAAGEAARKPRRGAGAAETCCYICWVKHGLCCDLKRVLKTQWSVALLKEMKARHSFFLMYGPNEVGKRIFRVPTVTFSGAGGIFNWPRGIMGRVIPVIKYIFFQIQALQINTCEV